MFATLAYPAHSYRIFGNFFLISPCFSKRPLTQETKSFLLYESYVELDLEMRYLILPPILITNQILLVSFKKVTVFYDYYVNVLFSAKRINKHSFFLSFYFTNFLLCCPAVRRNRAIKKLNNEHLRGRVK